MSDENEIDFDAEGERGDEPPRYPPIGSPEWRARQGELDAELQKMIRDFNDWKKAKRL